MEQIAFIAVETYDTDCPQRIEPPYKAAELAGARGPSARVHGRTH
ncbi:hypothetical protein ACWD01_00720 [Streptomyces sp. NPDC002835]